MNDNPNNEEKNQIDEQNEISDDYAFATYSYEGAKNYAFVTYSKEDLNIVSSNLKMIEDLGVDCSDNNEVQQADCQAPCRESKIKDSKIIIPFLTPNFVKSESCSLDIFYASFHKKPIIPVYLKETTLDKRLDFFIGKKPSILKYCLKDETYYNEFNSAFNAHLNDEENGPKQLNNLYFDGRKAQINVEGTSGMFTRFWERVKQFAYEGIPKPIYLSFSHENISIIYEDFELFKNLEIDFRYDEEIDFYNENESDSIWFNEVESLIKKCSLLFFYVSEKSLKSKRRLHELQYAIDRGIPICLIYIEELNHLPSSFEELLMGKPIIIRYEMNKEEYNNEYINQIRKAQINK